MPLCGQCSELDFSRYLNRKRQLQSDDCDSFGFEYWVEGVEYGSDAEDDGESEEERGQIDSRDPRPYDRELADDGTRHRQTCDLCILIARHIEKNHVGADEIVEIKKKIFCSTVDRETYRLSINAIPRTIDDFCGPLEAHKIPPASQKRARTILQLQECSILIPTTATEGFQSEKNQSRTSHSRCSGRVMGPKADLSLFHDWINRCGSLHKGKCGQSIWPEPEKQVLKAFLVIDVDHMCIVNAPENCRYVALSYCWGTASMFRHLLSNSAALRRDGSLTESPAPATILDAIELVKGVGERYLWVDALCIIQDDQASKQVQLAQMGLIYSLAAFTIVAAAGDNVDAGLPGIRAGTRKLDQDILRVGGKVFLTVIDGVDYYGGVKDSTWITRAWTMQEKILSKKLLIFTDEQVYWKCWNALWLEETALEKVPKISFFYKLASAGPSDIGFDSLVDGSEGLFGLYQSLVNAYLERQLSFKADIINAFSGLCQAFTAIEDEKFHWGLPVSRFDTALCWWLRAGGQRNYAFCDQGHSDSTTSSVPFPSWSWAAWHGSSARGWISWIDLDDSSSEEPPEIIFYCQNTGGKLHRVMEPPAASSKLGALPPKNTKSKETASLRSKWKLAQQTVDETSYNGPLNTGLLHFWTSTARLHVSREPSTSTHDGFRYFPIITHVMIQMDVTSHLQFQEVDLKLEVPEGILNPSAVNTTREILVMEFVVVSTYKEEVCAIAVEWKDGVAYRVGILHVSEMAWVGLRNREWKMVTLG